jgi:hypothetical protein
MQLSEIVNRYAASPQPQAETPAHYDAAARATSAESLGGALSSMFRSSSTPPFGEIVGHLFGQSSTEQRAGLLNHLVQSLGPAATTAGGGLLGKLLGARAAGTPSTSITPEQASQVSPSDVAQIAAHAEQQNPSVVDKVGAFYAQHPTLVKTLGVGALAVALGHMQKQQS